MKTPISCIVTSVLAAAVALGCRTEDGATSAAAVQQPEPAVAPEPAAAPEPQQDPERAAAKTPAVQDPKQQDPKQDPKQGDGRFLENAFPPTVPDTEWHQDAWMKRDCLRCHETGVGDAPELEHRDMPDVLLTAMCRSCHVFVPGSKPRQRPPKPVDERFEENAFPPMMPASEYHQKAWLRTDCLLCHENGIKGAPKIVHEGMSPVLLVSKCRTCHVQVRVVEVQSR